MSVNKNLFLRVQGVLLLYDVTKLETFEHSELWMQSIRDICDNIPVVLVGNKIDLPTRVVSTKSGQDLADRFNVPFLEGSAKEGTNVKEAFCTLAEIILQKVKKEVQDAGLKISGIESVNIHDDIKIGGGDRDKYIENYIKTLERLGQEDIHMVCYNFMPVFDWLRSDLANQNADGTAMTGKPTFPNLQNLDRMREIIIGFIEQAMTQTRTNNR